MEDRKMTNTKAKEKVQRCLKELKISRLDICIILKELYFEIGLNVPIDLAIKKRDKQWEDAIDECCPDGSVKIIRRKLK